MSRLPDFPRLIPNQIPYTTFYVMNAQTAADVAVAVSTQNFSFLDFWGTDPQNAVVSLRFYPFNMYYLMNVNPNLTNIHIAGKDTGITQGFRIGDNPTDDMRVKFVDFGNVNISRYYNDFRDFEPYTECTVYIPAFGWHKIPLDILYNFSHLGALMAIDYMTGYANLYLIAFNSMSDRTLISQLGKKIAIDIPLSLNNSGEEHNEMIANIASGAVSMIGGIIGGAAVGGGVAGAIGGGLLAGASSAMKEISSYKVEYTMSGAFGSFASLYDPMTAHVRFKRSSQDPALSASVVGKPLNQIRTLSTLSGYTQVARVNVTMTGQMTRTEADEIESMLHDGVIL